MASTRAAPHHEVLRVRDFVETLLAEFEPTALARRVKLDVLIASSEIEIAPTLLLPLLASLVGDALRRAPTGTNVTLAVSRRGLDTEFRVTHEGAGIAVEPNHDGLDAVPGGLTEVSAVPTLCKLAAEAHGGRLTVDETNTSIVVCLSFPSAPDGTSRLAPSESGTFTYDRELVDGPAQATILVVDDEPMIRSFVRRALNDAEYNVLEADCAERAIAILKAQPVPISLLLSDVGLPGASGADLVRQTRLLLPALPALLMSANSRQTLLDDGVIEQDTTLLQKPFTTADLLAELQELLTPSARHRTSRALNAGRRGDGQTLRGAARSRATSPLGKR